jgi:hypothetical protein
MRKVFIATPCYDGKLPVFYVDSLFKTLDLCRSKGINISYQICAFDAIVQKARDVLFAQAVEADVDDLVFIDADQWWKPEDFLRLLHHPVDFVGAMVPKKQDTLELCFGKLSDTEPPKMMGDLMEVAWVGMGLTRLSSRAIGHLWGDAMDGEYTDKGKTLRSIFRTSVSSKGAFVGEDVTPCLDWRNGWNMPIYVDTTFKVGHWGPKMYTIP